MTTLGEVRTFSIWLRAAVDEQKIEKVGLSFMFCQGIEEEFRGPSTNEETSNVDPQKRRFQLSQHSFEYEDRPAKKIVE